MESAKARKAGEKAVGERDPEQTRIDLQTLDQEHVLGFFSAKLTCELNES